MKPHLTGGPLYHLRAGLKIKGSWRDFKEQVHQWLTEWNPQKPQLVLIGPSAGWTLPRNFLRSFEQIHAYDLDPLARGLFAINHRVRVQWHREDAVGYNGEKLLELIPRHPDAAFLFCNVLGQLGLLYKMEWGEDCPEEFITNMRSFFAQCATWGSYHERLSIHKAVLVDHMTEPLFQNFSAHGEFRWSFSPQSVHVIDWVTSRARMGK